MRPAAVLRTFAELAKSGPDIPTDVLRSPRDMEWLPYKTRRGFEGKAFGAVPLNGRSDAVGAQSAEDQRLERLLSAGVLHQTERLLRVGWLWLAGTVERDGGSVRFCFPVLSVPVGRPSADASVLQAIGTLAASSALGLTEDSRMLRTLGDPEITPLITNDAERWALLESVDFGETLLKDGVSDMGRGYLPPSPNSIELLPQVKVWCERAAAAVGLSIDEWLTAGALRPPQRSQQAGVTAFVGFGLYIDQAPVTGTQRGDLLSLALLPKLDDSAFGSLYSSVDLEDENGVETVALRPLSAKQRAIATRAGSAELAVISGAPGTGKSHVLAVIALSAVARGESVLLVGSSAHSVDVLLDHLANTPGPPAVAFGGSRHGERLAAEMADLLSAPASKTEHDPLLQFHDRRTSVERALRTEVEAIRQEQDPTYRIDCTAELDRAGDLDDLRKLLDRVQNPRALDFRVGAKRRKLEKRLGVSIDEIPARIETLTVKRDAQRLLSAGGLTLDAPMRQLVELDDRAAVRRGDLVTEAWLSRVRSKERTALASIAHAMNSTRSNRRRALGQLRPADLVRAAPLWVSTANDVDEVLPLQSGMFDLVILDEASQMTQANAAAALVRGKRAIVCGDPRQLNQVSFLADDDVREAAAMFETNADVLDPRRNSAFDMAAMRVPVQRLDEHFRSAPHLIEFSARRFYGGSLQSATRHPKNEAADHIHVELVEGGTRGKSSKQANAAEVARCMELAKQYIDAGYTSIGFLSPFRAQADALEEAIIETYRLEEIDRYGLRVGTVHGFQGDERDMMILSWAVGHDEGDGAWRFVNQATLFNVMVTRAKHEVVVVTSVEKPPGLAGDYVAWSEPLTNLVEDQPIDDRWVQRVARAVEDLGVPVRTGYPVGNHVVDLVIGEGERSVAVECRPHPDGVAAHLDRAALLQRGGWETADAFESRWRSDAGQLAIELSNLVR